MPGIETFLILMCILLGITLIGAGCFIALLMVDNHELAVDNDRLSLELERKIA